MDYCHLGVRVAQQGTVPMVNVPIPDEGPKSLESAGIWRAIPNSGQREGLHPVVTLFPPSSQPPPMAPFPLLIQAAFVISCLSSSYLTSLSDRAPKSLTLNEKRNKRKRK